MSHLEKKPAQLETVEAVQMKWKCEKIIIIVVVVVFVVVIIIIITIIRKNVNNYNGMYICILRNWKT